LLPLLRAARRRASAGREPEAIPIPEAALLDAQLSAWKVEGRGAPEESVGAIAAFEALLAARSLIDFDDLVVGAVTRLERDDALRAAWQARFSHPCVDAFQDVDSAQLRLIQLLAAPEDHLFVVVTMISRSS